MRKKILFLGGAAFQTPPILYAREKGHIVITADNRPQNPGHRLADRYYNVSTIDKETILRIARSERIDAVLTFGSDVSAPTAAYIASRMDLPGTSYDATLLLTNKALFRKLACDAGLATVTYRSVGSSRVDLQACKLEYSIVSPK